MSNKLYKSIFFKDARLPFVEARFVVDSNYHYNKHFHNTLSIGAIEKGEVTYLHQTSEYTLKPNELSIINPKIIHRCNPTNNKSRTYHMIYVDPIWCQGIQSTIFNNVDSYINIKDIQIYDKILFKEFLTLNHTLLNPNILYLKKEELLENFFRKLFRKHCNKNNMHLKNTLNTNNSTKQKINKAKKFIEDNYSENITINDICNYVGLSKFYLIKLFKENLHISPHEYLLNCKINIAKQLLSKGMDSSEVAYEIGFFDQSHFSKVFKKYIAATPNEYKRTI